MDEVFEVAENKSEYTSQNYKNQREYSMFIGIGIGAVLLVLAEIGCILAQIYYMLSHTGSFVVFIISTLLLLGITGAFIYILKNALFKKIDEQKQQFEELLRISKATYMKTKKLSGQSGEDGAVSGADGGLADRIREDVERIQKEQGEELYKRQMAVANVQIKRTRESVMNMVCANEYIIEVMEEKLGADSALASQGAALEELQKSVAQLYVLYEKLTGDSNEPDSEAEPVILPEVEDFVPEPEEELPETEEFMPEMVFEAEEEEYVPEIEMDDLEDREPAGVDIEPLPEEVLENIEIPGLGDMEPELEDLLPELEDIEPEAEEILPELESVEEDGDPNRPMSPEEIEALLNNL